MRGALRWHPTWSVSGTAKRLGSLEANGKGGKKEEMTLSRLGRDGVGGEQITESFLGYYLSRAMFFTLRKVNTIQGF